MLPFSETMCYNLDIKCKEFSNYFSLKLFESSGVSIVWVSLQLLCSPTAKSSSHSSGKDCCRGSA